jgi:hypothetical protein
VAGGLAISAPQVSGATPWLTAVGRGGLVQVYAPDLSAGTMAVIGEARLSRVLTCASAAVARVSIVSVMWFRVPSFCTENRRVCLLPRSFPQESTVAIAAGDATGTLHVVAFQVSATAAEGVLCQRFHLGAKAPASAPSTNTSVVAEHAWSPPISAVALHHENVDLVAIGDEGGGVAVASLGFASAAAAATAAVDFRELQPLWSVSAASGGLPILAARWWPHAASTLVVAAGSSVWVADVRSPPPPGQRLEALPRYTTTATATAAAPSPASGGGGGRGRLPPVVTCLAFESAPCTQPWLVWGGTAQGTVAVWDLRSTGAPLEHITGVAADAGSPGGAG